MNPILIDTSGWAALFVRGETQHQAAVALFRQLWQQGYHFVTTNYILTELISLFISPLRVPHSTRFDFIDTIKATPYLEIIHVDAHLDAAAWAFLKARPDKEWSLVDAVSFLVMQDRGFTEALTGDHHFEQAGFIRLLRS